MASKTAAQEEFDDLLAKASVHKQTRHQKADSEDYSHDRENSDREEEEEYTQKRVDENMRMPSLLDPRSGGTGGTLHLPHRDFDKGRTTGVKGVIADARSYEEAKRDGSYRRLPTVRSHSANSGGARQRNTITSKADKRASTATFLKDDGEDSEAEDEDFLERWREQRREELRREGNDIRNRRTSPSVRRYGRFDEVDALGYLDAIERVTRETVVVVFVYDHECPVSQIISDALTPLVASHPQIHFVRVHYEAIEFDNAGVPAILAYKNQGDLFANLTYIIDQIPEDTLFDTRALELILRKNKIF